MDEFLSLGRKLKAIDLKLRETQEALDQLERKRTELDAHSVAIGVERRKILQELTEQAHALELVGDELAPAPPPPPKIELPMGRGRDPKRKPI